MRILFYSIASVLLLPGAAHTTEFFWFGGTGDFSDSTNWLPGEGPPGASDVATFEESTAYTVNVNGESTSQTRLSAGSVTFNGNYSSDAILLNNSTTLSGSTSLKAKQLLTIAETSAGTLTINGGASISATLPSDVNVAIIGQSDKGEVYVSGQGSKMSVSGGGGLTLGNGPGSTGNLYLSSQAAAEVNGPSNSVTAMLVGGYITSIAEVQVNGAGTSLDVSRGSLEIGRDGLGRVDVFNQGVLNIDDGALLLGTSAEGDGTLVLDGSGASLMSGPGEIARSGVGRIDVTGGAHAAFEGIGGLAMVLASNAASSATVVVDGAGSTMTLNSGVLEIGRQGSAEMFVTGGAQVSVDQAPDVYGLTIGSASGSSGRLWISGGQSKVSTNQTVTVAHAGSGSLSIASGAKLNSHDGTIGDGGAGAATVNGPESEWNLTGELNVGEISRGTLTVGDGARVSATSVTVGTRTGGDGKLYLTGPSAQLVAKDGFFIGGEGKGELIIQNGASFSPSTTFVVGVAGGEGSMFVDGHGTSFVYNSTLNVGNLQPGNLTVENDATSTLKRLELNKGSVNVLNQGILTVNEEFNSDRDSQIVVDGGQLAVAAGGLFTSQAQFNIGRGADANSNVSITNGGKITANSMSIGVDGGHGQVNVSNNGNLTASFIYVGGFGAGDSVGKLMVGAGGHVWATNELNVDSRGGTLDTTGGGSVDIGLVIGQTPANTTRIGLGGRLDKSGTLNTNIDNQFGFFRVGGSPGLVNLAGGFTQEAGATMAFTLEGTTAGDEYSQLAATGDVDLDGTIKLEFRDGFVPAAGDVFQLVTVAGTFTSHPLQFDISGLMPGWQYTTRFMNGAFELVSLSNAVSTNSQGDFDQDGDVDGTDFLVWQRTLGSAARAADADGNGLVEAADLKVWRNHFGQTIAQTATHPVPEPTSLLLVVIPAACRLAGRRNLLFS
jgi:T5SS/PEP-CTERM-associated repeat protein